MRFSANTYINYVCVCVLYLGILCNAVTELFTGCTVVNGAAIIRSDAENKNNNEKTDALF